MRTPLSFFDLASGFVGFFWVLIEDYAVTVLLLLEIA